VFHESNMSAKSLIKKKASVDKKCRLIVRNIPWEYQESELLKIFSVHGKVVEVNLPRKYPNGPLRGFAYIQYKNIEEAEKAINTMNETKHHGRTIAVDWSLPKDKYLEALKSQQGKHFCEQNNDYHIDSYIEGPAEESNENETDEGDNGFYENSMMDIDHDESEVDSIEDSSKDIDHNDEGEVDSVENNSKNNYSVKKKIHTLSEDAVLFVRNLSFEATEEELSDMLV
ncbi:3646_t:CDS:2, partial [Cetraspora pellucida]